MNTVVRKHGYALSMVRLSHFLGQGAIESRSLAAMQETSMEGNIVGVNLFGRTRNQKSKIEESRLGHWYGAIPSEDDPWFRSTKHNSFGVLMASSYNSRNGNLGDPDAQKFRGRGVQADNWSSKLLQILGLSRMALQCELYRSLVG